ncbi:MAG: c-type cytochrome biogenesis protein CcmI [Rhodocyclaceae bacterium]|nr:c-type cytochrome biogenesis protein CcmI [Rhodocyclaceae bacterium]MBX3667956.1 c-type cytochrome biogenesis protein CcmI [Rhodocyclaceae bacterium]
MTLFFVFAALLILGAGSFLLPPLLRRHAEPNDANIQAQASLALLRKQYADLEADHAAGRVSDAEFESVRTELQARVLEDTAIAAQPAAVTGPSRSALALVIIGLPAAALALYGWLGSPDGLDPAKIAARPQQRITPEQIEQMVAKLAARMENEPDNIEGWTMLGRSYSVMGRFDEAAKVYAKLLAKDPKNAKFLADYADVSAAAAGGSLLGEPEALITRALAIDPKLPKALALAGSAAFERKNYKRAAELWTQLLEQLPPDSEMHAVVQGNIEEARAAMGGGAPAMAAAGAPPARATAPAAVPTAAAAGQTWLAGRVELDPALKSSIPPDATLFIFVRAPGGGMPLAMQKHSVRDLPLDFSFAAPASAPADAVVVGARVSMRGTATPGPGDAEGFAPPAQAGSRDLRVRIDRVRPAS